MGRHHTDVQRKQCLHTYVCVLSVVHVHSIYLQPIVQAGCDEGDRVIVFSDCATLRAELEPTGVRFE